jgi:hypothetical protein
VIPEPRVVLLHHLLIFVHQNTPVTVKIVSALQVDLVPPFFPLRYQQIHQCRLVVGFELRPADERAREQFPGVEADFTLRSHRRPCVQDVERPLAVTKQEAAGVKADPVLAIVDELLPSVHDEVVVLVALEGELKDHVCEHGVTVHPPDKLHLRVGKHELADERKLGPKPRHLTVKMRHVVEDLDAVKAAVIDLVLDGLQEEMISHGVLTRGRSRTSDQQNPRTPAGQKVGECRIFRKPFTALVVPVGDLGAEAVWDVRISLHLRFFHFFFHHRGTLVVGTLCNDLRQDPVRLPRRPTTRCSRISAKSCFRCPKLPCADGAPQNQHRHEQAQQRNLGILHRPLDLPNPACSQREKPRSLQCSPKSSISSSSESEIWKRCYRRSWVLTRFGPFKEPTTARTSCRTVLRPGR